MKAQTFCGHKIPSILEEQLLVQEKLTVKLVLLGETQISFEEERKDSLKTNK